MIYEEEFSWKTLKPGIILSSLWTKLIVLLHRVFFFPLLCQKVLCLWSKVMYFSLLHIYIQTVNPNAHGRHNTVQRKHQHFHFSLSENPFDIISVINILWPKIKQWAGDMEFIVPPKWIWWSSRRFPLNQKVWPNGFKILLVLQQMFFICQYVD